MRGGGSRWANRRVSPSQRALVSYLRISDLSLLTDMINGAGTRAIFVGDGARDAPRRGNRAGRKRRCWFVVWHARLMFSLGCGVLTRDEVKAMAGPRQNPDAGEAGWLGYGGAYGAINSADLH